MPEIAASHWSRKKASLLKPTILYSARQHANEVSSTSHVLRLAEMLLTEPEHRKKLDRVNVVVHPIQNPDGAQLAWDMHQINPEHILHAGYWGSLGIDSTSDSDEPMPIYPEAEVRPRLWRMWLPDIFLNPHGYPAHQLVQLFSEFSGLVRAGRRTERNWGFNKGWFMPGFDVVDDPELPRHKAAALRLRDYITNAIRSTGPVAAMNERNYGRYRRYGMDLDPEVFRMDLHNGVNIGMPIKGRRVGAPGRNFSYDPRITIWAGGTEAPRRTGAGGLDGARRFRRPRLGTPPSSSTLLDGDHRVNRNASEFFGGVSLVWTGPGPRKTARRTANRAATEGLGNSAAPTAAGCRPSAGGGKRRCAKASPLALRSGAAGPRHAPRAARAAGTAGGRPHPGLRGGPARPRQGQHPAGPAVRAGAARAGETGPDCRGDLPCAKTRPGRGHREKGGEREDSAAAGGPLHPGPQQAAAGGGEAEDPSAR